MEVTVRATPQAVRHLLGQLRKLATNPSASNRLAKAILIRAGLAALRNVQKAFVTKAERGTDEAGESWKELAPSTIRKRQAKAARGKRGKRKKAALSALPLILRDTGLLFNSLTPGVSTGGHLPGRKKHQVFQLEGASVIIGTNRLAAIYHHEGRPPRLPQRRLWPEIRQWPETWQQDMLVEAREGLLEVIQEMLAGGTS